MDGRGQITEALICEKLTIKHICSDYGAVIGTGGRCLSLALPLSGRWSHAGNRERRAGTGSVEEEAERLPWDGERPGACLATGGHTADGQKHTTCSNLPELQDAGTESAQRVLGGFSLQDAFSHRLLLLFPMLLVWRLRGDLSR